VLFNSFEFLVFLPIVFLLYWFVFKRTLQLQNILLLLASYFFYGWWSWKFLLLLALSTILDYLYGFWVASPNRKKATLFLWLSIINNLGILGVFKYYNFFAQQFQQLFDQFGFHTNPVLIQVALPVGISFYTFHGMSYVFDIYRGRQIPVKSFVDYAVFVSFFPLLVAGPIERANHLLPQVQRNRLFSYTQAVEGCRLIIWGLFKKVVIADQLATIVDPIFAHYQSYNGVTLVLGAIAFSFQIYGDFSGYSDIALGTAKLFGFELLSNFKFPYFSRDVAEFWRRWHISLSSWFRDYLYIPLGGSKKGKIKAIRNTFIIFLVSGFWHGASWNFIFWGGFHACGFLPLLLLNRNRKYVSTVVAENSIIPSFKELFQMIRTFLFVTIAWVFFRANGLAQAVNYLKRIAYDIFTNTSQFSNLPKEIIILLYITPLLMVDWWLRRDERILKMPSKINSFIIYAFLATSILYQLFMTQQEPSFIYFQF
jgi:alginate O-acetyltransferase complex protein AlgI